MSSRVGVFKKGEPVRGIAQLVGLDDGSMTVSASQSSRSDEDGVSSLENGVRWAREFRRDLTLPIILPGYRRYALEQGASIRNKQTGPPLQPGSPIQTSTETMRCVANEYSLARPSLFGAENKIEPP